MTARPTSVYCPICGSVPVVYPAWVCPANCPTIKRFVQTQHQNDHGARQAAVAAERLFDTICDLQGTPAYREATAHGASSSLFQHLLFPTLRELGFREEVNSRSGEAAFRPDFMLDLPDGGIMVEVERGKTIDNNMDMLDMWKCHVHESARHLILAVPVWYVKLKRDKATKVVVGEDKTPTFAKVCRRMSGFFAEGNETNVRSLHVLGY